MFSGVVMTEEIDGVQDEGSVDTTKVDVQTLREALSLRSTCFIVVAVFWNK